MAELTGLVSDIAAGRPVEPISISPALDDIDALAVGLNMLAEELHYRDQIRDHWVTRMRHLDRVATIGETAASVAHELRNPLQAIELCAKLLTTADEDRRHQLVEMLMRASANMTEIVRRTLSFSRREAENIEPVCMADVVEGAFSFVEAQLNRSRIRVSLELGTSSYVNGNKVELGQVVLNLLTNAADAIEQGAPDSPLVRIEVRDETDEVVTIVEDNGPGLPVGAIDSVFDPFYTTKREGVGLGLGICRRIVDEHGGILRAENYGSHGKGGARFTLRLPMVRT